MLLIGRWIHNSAAAKAVPALIAALADADGAVRREAAVDLGEIGPAAAEAVPALIAALADANAVRREAADALERIGVPGAHSHSISVTWIPEKVRRSHAFGLINRPDEFVHLVLDALDASVPGEPTML